MTLIVIMTVLN